MSAARLPVNGASRRAMEPAGGRAPARFPGVYWTEMSSM